MSTAVPALGNTPAAPLLPADTRTDEFADYPRDQWNRPLIARLDEHGAPIPNPLTGQTDRFGTPIPWLTDPYVRASTLGGTLEHEGAINDWRIRQAVIGFMARPDLFALAQTVHDPGGEGRSELDGHIKTAQDAAGSGAAANRGTAGHAFAEKYDRGQPLPALGKPFGGWLEAYKTLTEGWRWSEIESRLVCRELRSAGRTDRLGSPPGFMIAPDGQIIGPDDVVCVDLKTSSSSKYFGVKFAVQLAVYGHGERYDPATGLFTPTGARRDWALVLHIPSGATSGSWWWVNIGLGLELGHLANRVLDGRRLKSKLVAQVAQVYATLDEALAAGGVLLDENYAAPDPAEVAATAEVTGESELDVERRLAAGPAAYSPIAAEAGGSGFVPHPTAGTSPGTDVPPTAALGPMLQAGHEPDSAHRQALQLRAVREANPRGGLAALRERFAADWGAEHEAAATLRAWQLDVLAALEDARSVERLREVWAEVAGYGAWTDEMDRVIKRRAREINPPEDES